MVVKVLYLAEHASWKLSRARRAVHIPSWGTRADKRTWAERRTFMRACQALFGRLGQIPSSCVSHDISDIEGVEGVVYVRAYLVREGRA